jgi:uncharacterized LabA/DUF88 family protein
MSPKATNTPPSRAEERVMVFIDGSNLYHVLGQICGRHDLQFDKFAQKLANGRDLKRVYYYNIRQEFEDKPAVGADQSRFLQSLYDTPYMEVKLGIWKQRGGTMVEKGVDVMLATDLVVHGLKDHYDTAIVVSGDADFYPALQAAKDGGKHVEVAAFDANISSEAARTADLHIKLNKTFFTSLWMTRTQQRALDNTKPEVTDEAASPNGEDKAATRASSRRRSGASSTSSAGERASAPRSRPSSPGTSGGGSRSTRPTRGGSRGSRSGSRAARNGHSPEAAPEVQIEAPRVRSIEPVQEDERNIRRTPSRRKIGGTTPPATGVSRVRPPAPRLRNVEPQSNGDDRSPAVREAAGRAEAGNVIE